MTLVGLNYTDMKKWYIFFLYYNETGKTLCICDVAHYFPVQTPIRKCANAESGNQ